MTVTETEAGAYEPAFSVAYDATGQDPPTDEFTLAFSVAFDPAAGPQDEFSLAFGPAFEPSGDMPLSFVLTGYGLAQASQRLALVAPDGDRVLVNTVSVRTRTRIECTWSFTDPGTYSFVMVATGGAEVSNRLPVAVTT